MPIREEWENKLPKRILALDPNTERTGWAFWHDHKIKVGSIKTSARAKETTNQRIVRQWGEIMKLINHLQPDVLVSEDMYIDPRANKMGIIKLAYLVGGIFFMGAHHVGAHKFYSALHWRPKALGEKKRNDAHTMAFAKSVVPKSQWEDLDEHSADAVGILFALINDYKKGKIE